MAKKTRKTEEEKLELATDSSQMLEPVSNHDQSIEIAVYGNNKHVNIGSLIRVIRGQQVMLDFDLARLYGVTTSRLNEQVKRNIERFPDDFMFRLTKEELEVLKSQSLTSKSAENQDDNVLISQIATSKHIERRGGTQKPPYAFTRNGVGMLSSVLRSETAVGVNIRIMRAFTAIPQIVNQHTQVIQRIFDIEQHQHETDEKINLILDKIEEISPKQLPEQIFKTGCVWDAWSYVSDLTRSAKHRIVLIDNFVDDRVLSMLDKRADGVTATVHSRYHEQFQTDLKKHNEQYPAIEFVQLPHKNHDRFLIIDDKVYFMGASLKDIGASLCAITEMQASPETILEMLK